MTPDEEATRARERRDALWRRLGRLTFADLIGVIAHMEAAAGLDATEAAVTWAESCRDHTWPEQ